MKGVFYLLHDSPARRDDFISVTGDTLFPLYFCETRWVEDKCAAERLLEIQANIVKLVDYYDSLPKYKQPSFKTYIHVKNAVSDPFTKSKLYYFSYIAGLLQPFLKIYQTDKPMLPFLFDDLKSLVKTLLTNIVDSNILEKSKTTKELLDIKLDQNNLLKTNDVHIGFAASSEVRKLLVKDVVTTKQVAVFKKEARTFVIGILKKYIYKVPFKF